MTRKGVWNLQQTRDKYLQSLWANDINLYGLGYNANGTLGNNTRDATYPGYSSPIQIGTNTNWRSLDNKNSYGTSYFMVASKTDGTLWSWGLNSYGQLGQNGNELSTIRISSPTQIGSGTDWSNEISRGDVFASAIKTDGTLWMWGQNQHGALGQNLGGTPASLSSPVQIPGTWSKAYTGQSATVAIKTNGELWMWGVNTSGQLGQNSISSSFGGYSSPVQVPGTTWSKADVGNKHTLAIKTDGTLWAWGDGVAGPLGQNQPNNADYSSPVQIPGTNWSDCWSGAYQSFATKTDGTLWSWGANPKGSLGQNQNQSALDNASSPIQIGSETTWSKFSFFNSQGWWAIKTDGTLWGCGKLDNGTGLYIPTPDNGYSSPIQISSDARWDSITSWGAGAHALKATLTPSQL